MIHTTTSRLIKNTGYNLITEAADRVGNYLLVILISRLLDAVASGTFATASTYLDICLLISYWGFSNILTREVAKDPRAFGLYFSNSLFMRASFSLVTTVGIIGIVNVIHYSSEVKQILILLSLSVLGGSINQLISSAFMAFEKIKYLSIVSIFFSSLKVGLGFLLLSEQGGLLSVALLLLSCEYLSLVINWILLKKHLPKFQFQLDLRFCVRLLKISFPLFGIILVTALDSRTDIIIVSLFLGEQSVGYYAAVNTIMGLLFLLPSSVRFAALPYLARYSIEKGDKFSRALLTLSETILIITLPVTMVFFFLSREIVQIIFTSKFDLSYPILQIVVWSFLSFSLNVVATRALIVINQEKYVARATLISAVITIILSIIVAPLAGLGGVAAVRLGTSILLFMMCGYSLYKQGFTMIRKSVLKRLILVCIFVFIEILFVATYNKWIAVISGLVFYIAGLCFCKIITSKEVAVIYLILRSFVIRYPKNRDKG